MENTTVTLKQEVFDYVYNMLGGGMVDIDLDQSHYETALKKALTVYRQRSDWSVQESYVTLNLIKDQNYYTMPQEIIEVRYCFRRAVGARGIASGGGSLYDPFNLAYTNTYLLAGSGLGGLATYELFAQQQELVGRMFGSFIEFAWNPTTKVLQILQRPFGDEEILLHCYNYKPDSQLLTDYHAKQWLQDYTLATCKIMLGEARSKFATIAGPQGGTSLNGDALKNEGSAALEKLENDLKMQVAGGVGYGFTIG